MVVTASLARGAVHEAVRLNHEKVEAMWAAQARTPFTPPATRRRFDEWFRVQRRVFERAALLILFGRVGSRRGAFSVFLPLFDECGADWEFEIKHIAVEFSAGQIDRFTERRLPVTISGHAVERMFQRTESIEWNVIKECLSGASLFLKTGIPAYVNAGCRQCAIPAGRGLLVGQVVDGRLELRTFLPANQLQPRYEALRAGLERFLVERKDAIQAAALVSDDEAAAELRARLEWTQFKWLKEPYVPGVDPMDRVWEVRSAVGNS